MLVRDVWQASSGDQNIRHDRLTRGVCVLILFSQRCLFAEMASHRALFAWREDQRLSVVSPRKLTPLPSMRIAQHRGNVSAADEHRCRGELATFEW